MKSIVLSLCLTLALSNLVTIQIDCPSKHVSTINGICIRPDYLEGCQVYKNAKECQECY